MSSDHSRENPQRRKRGCRRQSDRDYNNRPDVVAKKLEWERLNRDRNKEYRRNVNAQLRLEALVAYGGNPPHCMCECGCKENRIPLLDLDHVNNDGADHRREICGDAAKSGNVFYRKLRKLGWPKDIAMRVLCIKCNVGRQRNGGQCVELGIVDNVVSRKPPKGRRMNRASEHPLLPFVEFEDKQKD